MWVHEEHTNNLFWLFAYSLVDQEQSERGTTPVTVHQITSPMW